MFENPLAEVLRGAFRTWVSTNKKYKETQKKMNPTCYRLADIALGELDIMAPGPLWTWYTRHHMRFNKMKNEDVRITIELLQFFLADYAHGRLTRKEETDRTKTDRPRRTNAAHRLSLNKSSER